MQIFFCQTISNRKKWILDKKSKIRSNNHKKQKITATNDDSSETPTQYEKVIKIKNYLTALLHP
jgi:hypothetical protein